MAAAPEVDANPYYASVASLYYSSTSVATTYVYIPGVVNTE